MNRIDRTLGLPPSQIRRTLAAMAMFAFLLGLSPAPAQSAIVPREILKTYFEIGDVPTQEQFTSLIDSMINVIDDHHLIGLRTNSLGQAMLLQEGETLGPLLDFSPASGLAPEWAGQSGFLGLAFSENAETHYGYLQLRGGEPGSAGPYPMFVTYFVFQDLPNTELQVTSVPEPSTLVLGAICGLLGLWKLARRPT
jgi:hypothetical protein